MRISDWSSDVCSSDLAGAWDRGTAGVDGALDAVLARPGDHALRLLALLHAAEADLAQQLHAGLGALLEVLLDHALLEHRRAGVPLHARPPHVVEGALSGGRQRLQHDEVLGAIGRTAGRASMIQSECNPGGSEQ